MILNIHGYGGSAQNSAYTALLSLGCDVTSPQLDYDAVCPEKVLKTLREMAVTCHADTLIGTSFGGFFAALLCAELHLTAKARKYAANTAADGAVQQACCNRQQSGALYHRGRRRSDRRSRVYETAAVRCRSCAGAEWQAFRCDTTAAIVFSDNSGKIRAAPEEETLSTENSSEISGKFRNCFVFSDFCNCAKIKLSTTEKEEGKFEQCFANTVEVRLRTIPNSVRSAAKSWTRQFLRQRRRVL